MSCWTEKFNLKYIKSKIYTSINQGLPFVYNYSLDIVSVFVDVEDVVDSNMKYDFTTNVRVYLNPLFKKVSMLCDTVYFHIDMESMYKNWFGVEKGIVPRLEYALK